MSAARYKKPAILGSIATDRNAIIEASAGTGKTYTLEHLVVDRILQGVAISEILVVTFTEKAASEMKGRIRERLVDLLELEVGKGEAIPDEEAWVLDEGARARLESALRNFDSSSISTIHAFCQRTLAEQAFASHRLFSESAADGRTMFGEAFLESLRSDFTQEEHRPLLEIWLARGTTESLLKLLGSSATERAQRLPSWDPDALNEALALFPMDDSTPALLEGAWKELKRKERAGTLLDRYGKVRDLLSQLDEEAGLFEKLSVVWAIQDGKTGDAWLETLRERLGMIPDGDPTLDRLRESVFLLGEKIPSLEALAVDRLLPPVLERLQKRKKREGLLDFDDMLLSLRESLYGPQGESLTRLLRSRFRYALIDEFQDTDEVQWEIFRKIFFESGGENILYVIGDPKQAIYQFRGADVETYLAAKTEILEAGGSLVVLEDCFRATPELIEGYNRILDQGAPFFSGEIRYDHPVRSGRKGLRLLGKSGETAPPVQLLRIPSKSVSQDRLLPAVGAWIAEEIRRITDPDDPLLLFDEGSGPRSLSHQEIYVLYRSGAEGRRIGEAFRDQGVPYAFYKEEGLFQTEEAWAWHDLLAALAYPEDRSLRLRLWMSPFFAIPLGELSKTRDLPAGDPLLQRVFQWKREAEERRYERLFPRILDESGVVRRAILEGDERGLTNLLHLSELLLERGQRSRCSLQDLVAWLRALIDERARPEKEGGNQQRLETEREAVQLMTLHASKGLEAAVVFLVGGVRSANRSKGLSLFHQDRKRLAWVGSPPGWVKELVDEEAAEENERLLYVGLTRAKARLYLPVYSEEATVNGTYAPLQRRLLSLGGELQDGDPHFSLEELSAEAAEAAPDASTPMSRPLPDEGDGEASRYQELREARRGFEITSYTRMRGFRGAGDWEEERVQGEQVVAPPGPDDLPGGAASGIFLHEVLARIPPGLVPSSLDDFRLEPEACKIFEEEAARHGIRGSHLDHAWSLVHQGLVTPIPLGEESRLEGGVVTADRWLPEMEFLYPIPEEGHPALGSLPQGEGYEVRRGFVKGFIDLIFQRGELVYFADWKSDCLPTFHPSYLHGYVARSYEIQARLYSLAVVKLLGITSEDAYDRRFGGLFYFFLRGMKAGVEEGIYFERPSWETLLQWEKELKTGGDE